MIKIYKNDDYKSFAINIIKYSIISLLLKIKRQNINWKMLKNY